MIPQGFQLDPIMDNPAAPPPRKSVINDTKPSGESFADVFRDISNQSNQKSPEDQKLSEDQKSSKDPLAVIKPSWQKAAKSENPKLTALGLNKKSFLLKKLPKQQLFAKDGKLDLDLLKKILAGNGIKLEDMVVGKKGLKALKRLLIESGADKGRIAELFKNLESKAQKGGIPLKELFSKLKDMDLTIEDEESPAMLEISILPYLESVLTSLGVKPEDVNTVLADAKADGLGIDISKLIKNIKTYMSKKRMAGQALPKRMLMEENSPQQHLLQMLKRVGQGETFKDNSPLTLDRLVAELENVRDHKSPQKTKMKKGDDTLARFLADVKPAAPKETVALKAVKDGAALPIQGAGVDKKILSMLDQNTNTKEPAKDFKLTDAKAKHVKHTGKVAPPVAPPQKGEHKETALLKDDLSSRSTNTEVHQAKPRSESPPVFDSIFKNSDHREKVAVFANSRPTTKQLPNYVLDQVNRQLARSVLNNENEVNLNLKPPHLGRLKLTIAHNAGGLRVNILAEHNTTRDMLVNHANDLKQVLADQGVRLEKVDVQISYNFDQSMAQTKQDAWNHQGRNKKRHMGIKGGEVINERASPELAAQVPNNNSGLDLIA